MGAPRLLDGRKLLRRARQIAYVAAHPIKHRRCAAVIERSGLSASRVTPLKYVGDHLALSLDTAARRRALTTHYATLPRLLKGSCAVALKAGLRIWHKQVADGSPPLILELEPSRLAPMEGELQLRFSFRSDLFVLTFLIAPGSVFGSSARTVLFIGGIQGRMGTREEVREASRLNDEIAPATMLILAVQAIARRTDVGAIIGVGAEEHISLGYARSRIALDYGRFWQDAEGVRAGRHFRLPIEPVQKPLREVSLSHRSRARRRREAKALVRVAIETRVSELFCAG